MIDNLSPELFRMRFEIGDRVVLNSVCDTSLGATWTFDERFCYLTKIFSATLNSNVNAIETSTCTTYINNIKLVDYTIPSVLSKYFNVCSVLGIADNEYYAIIQKIE